MGSHPGFRREKGVAEGNALGKSVEQNIQSGGCAAKNRKSPGEKGQVSESKSGWQKQRWQDRFERSAEDCQSTLIQKYCTWAKSTGRSQTGSEFYFCVALGKLLTNIFGTNSSTCLIRLF